MKVVYNDGGRAAAGYRGKISDCTVRAIAIVSGLPYQTVYDAIIKEAQRERPTKGRKWRRSDVAKSTGVFKPTSKRYLLHLGYKWTPTMLIGQGCKVHLTDGELPQGKLIVQVSKHLVAVIDGVIHDNHDPSREGTRCVYGYWSLPAAS